MRIASSSIVAWTLLICRRPRGRADLRAVLRTLVLPVSYRAAAVRGEGGGWAQGHPGKGGDMTEYLIAFNDEWVPDHTVEELREKSNALRPLVAEMKAAGVLIFTGGLDDAAPVFSVDASSGTPLFTDGPYVETKEHLGGFAVVDVADEEAARLWAGKIAVACGWPQEVRRFRVPMQVPEIS
jgi:hypothetical protein